MGIWTFITGIISPITDLLGKIVTKDEDALKVQAAISKIENEMAAKLVDYESKLVDARSKILIADAQGKSWLQRCCRPIALLTFLCLVVADIFDLLPKELPPDAWTLLKIGFGGHYGVDVAEKIAPYLSKNK